MKFWTNPERVLHLEVCSIGFWCLVSRLSAFFQTISLSLRNYWKGEKDELKRADSEQYEMDTQTRKWWKMLTRDPQEYYPLYTGYATTQTRGIRIVVVSTFQVRYAWLTSAILELLFKNKAQLPNEISWFFRLLSGLSYNVLTSADWLSFTSTSNP